MDNARNVKYAWQLLERPCMTCVCHTMNLSVKEHFGVEGIGNTFNRCRKVVGHFNHSNLAKEALKNKQRQLHLSEKSLNKM